MASSPETPGKGLATKQREGLRGKDRKRGDDGPYNAAAIATGCDLVGWPSAHLNSCQGEVSVSSLSSNCHIAEKRPF